MRSIENSLENIGNNIRVLRKAQKISQAKMAESIGISLSQYTRIENGEANASISTIIKVASFLETGIDLLVYGEEIKPENKPIAIKKLNLIEKMSEIEQMNPADQKLANQVLDLVIGKKELDKLVENIHQTKK